MDHRLQDRGEILDLTDDNELYCHGNPAKAISTSTCEMSASSGSPIAPLSDRQLGSAAKSSLQQNSDSRLELRSSLLQPAGGPSETHPAGSLTPPRKIRRSSSIVSMELDTPSPPPLKVDYPPTPTSGVNIASIDAHSESLEYEVPSMRPRSRLRALRCRAPSTPPPLGAGSTYRAFFEAWSVNLEWILGSEEEVSDPHTSDFSHRDVADEANRLRKRSCSPKKAAPIAPRAGSIFSIGNALPHISNDLTAKVSNAASAQQPETPILKRTRQAAMVHWDDIVLPYEQAYHLHLDDVDNDRNVLFDPMDARVDDLDKREPDAWAVKWRKFGLADGDGRGLTSLPMSWMARGLEEREDEEWREEESLSFGFERKLREIDVEDDESE